MPKHNTVDDFWERVDKSGDCWVWKAGTYEKTGYGYYFYMGKMFRAHRFVAEFHMGLAISGLNVCHTCDNPPCVNPDHLFLGTYQDNNDDRDIKDRQACGERVNLSVLTEEQVSRIRSPEFSGKTIARVAEEFGVCPSTIGNIRRGQTWKHLL